MACKALLETTNHGCCFADCTCGWAGGVYENRTTAREAHKAHVEGREPVGKIRIRFLVGPPAQGMLDGAS